MKIKCEQCGSLFDEKTFRAKSKRKHFCCLECYYTYMRRGKVRFNCELCGKEVETKLSAYNRNEHHFCSLRCGVIHRNKRLGNPRYEKECGNYVHRTVVEEILGRKLLPSEVVHHKDGNKLNNNPDNLIVMQCGEHRALHNRQRKRGDVQ